MWSMVRCGDGWGPSLRASRPVERRYPRRGELCGLKRIEDRLVARRALPGLRPEYRQPDRQHLHDLDDLDFTAGTSTIRRSLTKGQVGRTRTGKTRTIPMLPRPEMADALRSYKERVRLRDGERDADRLRHLPQAGFDPAAEAAKVNDGMTVINSITMRRPSGSPGERTSSRLAAFSATRSRASRSTFTRSSSRPASTHSRRWADRTRSRRSRADMVGGLRADRMARRKIRYICAILSPSHAEGISLQYESS